MYPQPNGPNALAPLCHTTEPRDIHQMNGRDCSQLQESPILLQQVDILTAEPQPAVQTLPTAGLLPRPEQGPSLLRLCPELHFLPAEEPQPGAPVLYFHSESPILQGWSHRALEVGSSLQSTKGNRPSFEFNNRFPEKASITE